MAENFEDMRQEAIRRVMEMQQRSQHLTGDTATAPPPPVPGSQPPPPGGALTDLLSGLNIDEEKAMIGLLIYILWKNGADKKLLLGLGYLIL